MAGEWHHLGGYPCPVLDDLRGVEGPVGLVEQAHGGKYGNDQVVVREIDVHRPVQREGLWRRKQGTVGLQAVVCGRICETADEFVDVPDALNGSQRAPIPDEKTVSAVVRTGRCDGYPVL